MYSRELDWGSWAWYRTGRNKSAGRSVSHITGPLTRSFVISPEALCRPRPLDPSIIQKFPRLYHRSGACLQTQGYLLYKLCLVPFLNSKLASQQGASFLWESRHRKMEKSSLHSFPLRYISTEHRIIKRYKPGTCQGVEFKEHLSTCQKPLSAPELKVS